MGNVAKMEAAAVLGLVALVAIGWAAAKKAGVLPGKNTFNPLSDQNLAYRGVNELYRFVTGNTIDTLGTRLAANYSDSVGEEITAPVPIVRPLAPSTGEGVSLAEFMANAVPVRISEGSGGAAFGIYPKP